MSTVAAPASVRVLSNTRSALARSCGSDTRTTPVASSDELAWAEVSPGLWVAQMGGNFAGMVERLWGAGFKVSDSVGRIVGEFSSLERAQGMLDFPSR